MPHVSVLEVVPAERYPRLVSRHLDIAQLEGVVAERPRTAYVRLYGRDDGDGGNIPGLGFTATVLRWLRALTRPGSALRNYQHRIVVNGTLRFRVRVATGGTLLALDIEPTLRGNFNRLVAELTAARPVDLAGDLVLEVGTGDAAVDHELPAALIERIHASLEEPVPAVAEAAPARPTPLDRARARREALLARGWPTSTALADRWGSEAANRSQASAELRSTQRLFGVWSTPERTYVHPDFQFTPEGAPHPQLPELLEALQPLIADGRGDRGGWRRAFWLYAPHPELDGRRPADVFAGDPARVIAVARAQTRAIAEMPA